MKNLTKEHFKLRRPNYSEWDFNISSDLQNYLINLSFESEDLIADKKISDFIKIKTKNSFLFDVTNSEFDFITKVGVTMSDCFILRERVDVKSSIVPFALQDRNDEGNFIRKEYSIITKDIDELTKWFRSSVNLINQGALFYLPQIKIDRKFDTSNTIENNTEQIRHLINNGLVLKNIEPFISLTIPHFDNVSISKISEIVHNNPDIAGRFSRILINGLLKVKNSTSDDSRKLIIKEIEMEFEYKLKELEKAHVRLKKDLFKKSNFNVFAASTLSISGFYLEKGFMHFLIPGGYIIARQAMDFLDYYKQKRQLKENEFYFLYTLRNQ